MAEPLRQTTEFEPIYDLKLLQGFEGDLKKELLRVMAMLSQNPIQPPMTTGPHDQAGELYIYMQPDPHLQLTYRVDLAASELHFVHIASSEILSKTQRVVVARTAADEAWWKKLRRFAGTLRGVVFWDIGDVADGGDPTADVLRKVDAADMALLLVTQDYIVNEGVAPGLDLPGLVAKHRDEKLKVQWIPVRASTWKDDDFLEKTKPLRPINEPAEYLEQVPAHELDSELLAITDKLRELLR